MRVMHRGILKFVLKYIGGVRWYLISFDKHKLSIIVTSSIIRLNTQYTMYIYIGIGLFCFLAGIVAEQQVSTEMQLERQRRGSYRPPLLIGR